MAVVSERADAKQRVASARFFSVSLCSLSAREQSLAITLWVGERGVWWREGGGGKGGRVRREGR